MSKTYKDYCREAVARDPKTYGQMFNEDGSRKPTPNLAAPLKKKWNDVPPDELKKCKRIPWAKPLKVKQTVVEDIEPLYDEPQLEIVGTEFRLKGRKLNLTMMEMPKNPTRQQYNKVWMHNDRVRQRIKKLKETYGATTTL